MISAGLRLTMLCGVMVMAGCGAEQPDITEQPDVKTDQEMVTQTGQELRQDGASCYARCSSGAWCWSSAYGYWGQQHPTVALTSVTSDCRAHAVNWCHAHGWSFYDAFWGWGRTGYWVDCF